MIISAERWNGCRRFGTEPSDWTVLSTRKIMGTTLTEGRADKKEEHQKGKK